jgi:hypothetical protein
MLLQSGLPDFSWLNIPKYQKIYHNCKIAMFPNDHFSYAFRPSWKVHKHCVQSPYSVYIYQVSPVHAVSPVPMFCLCIHIKISRCLKHIQLPNQVCSVKSLN